MIEWEKLKKALNEKEEHSPVLLKEILLVACDKLIALDDNKIARTIVAKMIELSEQGKPLCPGPNWEPSCLSSKTFCGTCWIEWARGQNEKRQS